MESKAPKTAMGPVFQVALEQLVPEEQRVIHDSVAYRLMPLVLKGFINLCRFDPIRRTVFNLMDHQVPGIRGGILCRKRFINEKMGEAVKAGIKTVVVLGAGFDTLAYRSSESNSMQFYEVDYPQIILSKTAELQREFQQVPAHVKLVSMDFENQELMSVLRQAGYSEENPTFFVWEGVTQYISETSVRKVFEFFKTAPPGSMLVFTYIRRDFIEGKHMYGLDVLYRQTRVQKQLWKFGMDPQAIGTLLGHYSWIELEQVGNVEYQERYLEPVKRNLLVMDVERAVHAERISN
jgi:methyltransferase (TIGR00027 family)